MKVIHYEQVADTYELRFSYDPFVISKIKEIVDLAYRAYRPGHKVWVIRSKYLFEKLSRVLTDEGYKMSAPRGSRAITRNHTPKGWVPANQRDDYVDPFARENDPRRKK